MFSAYGPSTVPETGGTHLWLSFRFHLEENAKSFSLPSRQTIGAPNRFHLIWFGYGKKIVMWVWVQKKVLVKESDLKGSLTSVYMESLQLWTFPQDRFVVRSVSSQLPLRKWDNSETNLTVLLEQIKGFDVCVSFTTHFKNTLTTMMRNNYEQFRFDAFKWLSFSPSGTDIIVDGIKI